MINKLAGLLIVVMGAMILMYAVQAEMVLMIFTSLMVIMFGGAVNVLAKDE